MKKLLALVLAVVMLAALTGAAAAANETNYTLTEIKVPDDGAWFVGLWAEGIFYSYPESFEYKYFDISGKPISEEEIAARQAAENASEDRITIIIDDSGKYVIIDTVTYKVIAELDYDYVENFSEGLAVVGKGDGTYSKVDGYFYANNIKYGFIDETGKVVVPLEYDSAGHLDEGFLWVGKGDGTYDKYGKAQKIKFGVADKTGKLITPLEYDKIGGFSEGFAIVGKGDGTYSTSLGYEYPNKTKYGYIDKTGKVVVPLEYDEARDFSEGLAVVGKGDGYYSYLSDLGKTEFPQKVKYGVIDTTGKFVVPLEYDILGNIRDGLTYAGKGDGTYDDEYAYAKKVKYGFIDKTGKVVIPLEYDRADYFYEGFAMVGKGDGTFNEFGSANKVKYGFIDKTGKILIPLEYDSADYFYEGLAMVGKGDGTYSEYGKAQKIKYGYIDKTGKVVIPLDYDETHAFDVSKSSTVVRKGGKWYLLSLGAEAPVFPVFPAAPAEPATAKPATSKVLVNGKAVAFDAYNINDSNYFKLRDLAAALNGTAKQFEVTYSAATGVINLTSGKPYTAVGGELAAAGAAGKKTATPATSKVFLDGKELNLTAYNINNANYFKLRDIAAAIGFAVDYDTATGYIAVDTGE